MSESKNIEIELNLSTTINEVLSEVLRLAESLERLSIMGVDIDIDKAKITKSVTDIIIKNTNVTTK